TALRGGARPCGACRSLPDLHLAVVSRATGPQDPVAAVAGQAHLGSVAQADDHLLTELDDLPHLLDLAGLGAIQVEPVPGAQLLGTRGHPQTPSMRGAPLLTPPQAVQQAGVVGVPGGRDCSVHGCQASQALVAVNNRLLEK